MFLLLYILTLIHKRFPVFGSFLSTLPPVIPPVTPPPPSPVITNWIIKICPWKSLRTRTTDIIQYEHKLPRPWGTLLRPISDLYRSPPRLHETLLFSFSSAFSLRFLTPDYFFLFVAAFHPHSSLWMACHYSYIVSVFPRFVSPSHRKCRQVWKGEVCRVSKRSDQQCREVRGEEEVKGRKWKKREVDRREGRRTGQGYELFTTLQESTSSPASEDKVSRPTS